MFGMLILAGLNIPFSEDAILIVGGAMASTCSHHSPIYIWLILFFGCWISAWEAYWIGRYFGPRLYEVRWFRRIINPSRIQRLRHYYEKFGIFTFIVGRFFPGGVRNALFMTTGLSKMHFGVFLLRDGIACLISTMTLFYLGYKFGENYQTLFKYFKKYELLILGLLAILIATALFFWWRHKKRANNHAQ